jgi:hypothetical protein
MTVAIHEPRDTRTLPGVLRWAQHDAGHQGAEPGVPL